MTIASRSRTARATFYAPVFGLSLLALVPGAAGAQTLPSGGTVAAGAATITTTGPRMAITQTSNRAVINWQDFSIGQGGTVNFKNGTGATLNRVTGGMVSHIDGTLSATGSVYLINPNGIVISSTGVVNTQGSFVASSLDIPDASFMAGGDLTFVGDPSTSQVVVSNAGKIGSSAGDVVLQASYVFNTGAMNANNGTAGLLAARNVTLRDVGDQNGRFVVSMANGFPQITNSGVIRAANVEIRAANGNIYTLAGQTTGIITATGVKTNGSDGRIWITDATVPGQYNYTQVAGQITASNMTKTAAITISGDNYDIQPSAKVSAGVGGLFTLIHTTDAVTSQPELNLIGSVLAGQTNVTDTAPNLTLGQNFSWGNHATLTLSADHALYIEGGITLGRSFLALSGQTIAVDQTVTINGNGGLKVNDSGVGSLSFAQGASFDFGSNDAGGTLNINNVAYTLIYKASGLDQIDGIAANSGHKLNAGANGVAGAYALGTNIDLTGTTYANSLIGLDANGNPFSGAFEGAGHTLTGLTVVSNKDAGLFQKTVGSIENLILSGGSVTSNNNAVAGAIAGLNYGTIANVRSDVAVNAANFGGGLVGYSEGVEANSSSSGTVQGATAGGLVGYQESGAITSSHATGAVSGSTVGGLIGYTGAGASISSSYAEGVVTASSYGGGLVGSDQGSHIAASYATGAVNGTNGTVLGGLVGYAKDATVDFSYATGSVTGAQAYSVGGLIGAIDTSTVNQAYASGVTTNPGGSFAGGLYGTANHETTNGAYYDSTLSPLAISGTSYDATETNVGGLTTSQFHNVTNFAGFTFTSTPGGMGWVIVGSRGGLNDPNDGVTRPLLASEYSTTITNGHQLQLMAMNLNATYVLRGDVTGNTVANTDVWGDYGFVSIGNAGYYSSFRGVFDGRGYSIKNLTIGSGGISSDTPSASLAGAALFGSSYGYLRNVTLNNVTVTGDDAAAALVGTNYGYVTNVSVSGTVSGGSNVGGIVALNYGGLSGPNSSASVNGLIDVGGLAGVNYGSVTGSTASGAVSGSKTIGGAVGRNEGSVYNDTASGAVSGDDIVGGLVGYNDGGTVFNSTATGTVTSPGKRKGPVIGLNQ